MSAWGWLSRCRADVPPGTAWLGPAERHALDALASPRRRRDWRLGRWTAKEAVGSWLTVAPQRVEILAAADGAPEAWLEGRRAPVSISLSHRAGRSLAVVASACGAVGCDLELIEPRSAAFVREWMSPAEQEMLAARPGGERARLANLLWTAKEAGTKVRREGLRLDVRDAVVVPVSASGAGGSWRALHVRWGDGSLPTTGWWRAEPRYVMSVAGDRALGPPRQLRERAEPCH